MAFDPLSRSYEFKPGFTSEEFAAAVISGDCVKPLDTLREDMELRELLDVEAVRWIDLSIYDHTVLVLSRLEKYPFLNSFPPFAVDDSPSFDKRAFVTLLVWHDINKHPIHGDRRRDKCDQHNATICTLDRYSEFLPINPKQLHVMRTLIAGDYCGVFFKHLVPEGPSKDLWKEIAKTINHGDFPLPLYFSLIDDWEEKAALGIRTPREVEFAASQLAIQIGKDAKEVGIHPVELLQICVLFYQCDLSSYTYDAKSPLRRATPSFDYYFERNRDATSPDEPLYVFNTELGRLKFSKRIEPLYEMLENAVKKYCPAA